MVFRIKAIVKSVGMYMDNPASPIYRPTYPEDQIKDMLRYDSGIIESKERIGDEVHFVIASRRYTKARWDSFRIQTEVIR